uniref:PID domain-containing protein n=1 Tax=Vombatus ursinus TaxID=29139 RepID=A0A4X2KX04_VOMUR
GGQARLSAKLVLFSPKAKASGKKLRKVTLKVSPRGIILHDSGTNELIENVSIYRISYCTADKMHDKVFAYIAQNQQSESLECHAFLCSKRKMVSGRARALDVSQLRSWGGRGGR